MNDALVVGYSLHEGFRIMLPDGTVVSSQCLHGAFSEAIYKLSGVSVEFTTAAMSKIRMTEEE